MAKCIYTIYIPGQGVLKVPSDHGIFVNKNSNGSDSVDYSSLDNLLNQLKEIEDQTSPQSDRIKADIQSIVRRVSSLPNLNLPDLDLTLENNKIISQINSLIENNSIGSFYKSLKNYLYKNSDNYTEILNKVSSKPTVNYFKDILTPDFVKRNRILRTSNLNTEIDKLSREITGYNDTHFENILTFLQAIKGIDKDAELLMGFSTELGLKAANFNDYVFYKHGDYDSLFMSLLKKVGSTVNLSSLNDILTNNKLNVVNTASDFFENQIVDGLVDNSKFENLLKDKKYNKAVSEIASLIGSELEYDDFRRDRVTNSVKAALKNLNPATYGEYARQQIILEQRFNEAEKILNDTSFNRMTINFGETNGSFRADTADEKYAAVEEVGSTDYTVVKSKIEEGKDIVQFPIGDVTPYVLVTKIFNRANGVHIYGVYKSDTKGYVHVNKQFLNDDVIRYRKYEGDLQPVTDDEIITNDNRVSITLSKGINRQELIKAFVRKGDVVKKGKSSGTVFGVYPGYIFTSMGEKFKYSEITSFESSVLHMLYDEDVTRTNLNSYVKLKDNSLISRNDIIEDPRPEARGRKVSVVATSENEVFVLTGTADNRFVYPINKADIRNAWMFAYDQITQSEINQINNTLNNAVIKSKDIFSRFTNPLNAQPKDYFVGTVNGVEVTGKVLENNKIIYVNPNLTESIITVKSIEDIKNPLFLTTRNIHSQYAMSDIRMNNWSVSFSNKPKDGYSEIKYIVPDSVDPETLFLIPGYYANVGSWVEKTFNKSGFKDVTKKVLDLINMDESGIKTQGLKPYAKVAYKTTNGFNVMVRNTTSTQKIIGFEDLDSRVKKQLKVLNPGVYISVVDNNGNIKSDIYRIIDVSSEHVIAHLNKINDNGDIITQEEIFAVDALLADRGSDNRLPAGAIHSLYVLNGNNKLNTLFTTSRNKLNIKDFKNYQTLNKLVDKMTDFYNPYGVKVVVDFSGENFESNQRAKLQSDQSGQVRIVLNGLKGDKSDLIHENLHIILTALRLQDVNTYGKLINSIVDVETDVYNKEELFVERIISKVNNGSFDALGTNLAKVIDGLIKAVQTINPDIELNLDNLIINPYELLNKSVKDVFKVDNSYDSPYFNMSVLQMEPAFRNWMKNNVTLKCT